MNFTRPFELTDEQHDFIEGMKLIAGAGEPTMRAGLGVFMYTATVSMTNKSFYSSDGDFLIGQILLFFLFQNKIITKPLHFLCSARTRNFRHPNRIWQIRS